MNPMKSIPGRFHLAAAQEARERSAGLPEPELATWRKLIGEEMKRHGESFGGVVSCTLRDIGLDAKFDDGFGHPEGEPFTLWTKKRVYFPVVYDGAERVKSVPRSPCAEPTEHVGGW
jgi:hypothetical protein